MADQDSTPQVIGMKCSIPCDPDCDVACHEDHSVRWKREPHVHTPIWEDA